MLMITIRLVRTLQRMIMIRSAEYVLSFKMCKSWRGKPLLSLQNSSRVYKSLDISTNKDCDDDNDNQSHDR